MKFSLFENDRSTVKDEIILLLFILVWLGAGIALYVIKPTFWLFDETSAKVLGVLCIIIGAMFIPGLIYRLFTNDKKK